MALQICPKCKKKSFTWYIDEEETPLTQWSCWESECGCGYHAFEDENKVRNCPICGNGKSYSYMIEKDIQYWWCYRCGRTELIDSITVTDK